MTTTQVWTTTNHFQSGQEWTDFFEEDIQVERQLVCHGPSPFSSRPLSRSHSVRGYFLWNSQDSLQYWLVSASQVATMRSKIGQCASAFFIPQFTLKDVAENRGVNRSVISDSICKPVNDQIVRHALELQYHSRNAVRDRLVEDRLVEKLCGQIVESCLESEDRELSTRQGLTQPFIEKVQDYISNRIAFPIRMAELAALVSMSRFHFCRMFKRAIGVSPSIFVTHERLRMARRRLLEHCELSVPLAKIAFDCGFADQAHLTRHFRSYFGTTPGKFRDA